MPIKNVEMETSLGLVDFLTQDVECLKDKLSSDRVGYADFEGFTLLGEYKVMPQTRIAIGYRPRPHDQFYGGRIYIKLHETNNAEITGTYKIVLRNSEGTKRIPVVRLYSNEMSLDKTQAPLIKIDFLKPSVWVREDGYIQLLFKPDIDGKTIDYDNANNVMLIEITKELLQVSRRVYL